MGVPVVSLRGNGVHAQSVGASLLSAVQLDELATATEDEYVRQATETIALAPPKRGVPEPFQPIPQK
eukprot:111803-Amphidinium_carterae.1